MNIALVLAAGSGTRMNNAQPKQFMLVNNKPLFLYSVEAFQSNKDIDAIVIATNEEYIELVKDYAKDLNKVISVIKGGETRQQSVYNGLKEIEKNIRNQKDLVLIHDSARPLVSQRIIDENISLGRQFGAVDTVVAASDTIINSKDNVLYSTQEGHLIATLGIEDLVIAHTKDVTLICAKDKAQDIKLFVERLKEEGKDSYL